jgi:hypothetical protein
MSAPSWAAPGVMVVCVQDNWDLTKYPDVVCPVLKIVYTIRKVIRGHDHEKNFLILEEIRNNETVCRCGCGIRGKPGFLVACFRPVKTTSIDDLVSLTRPTRDQVYDELKKQIRCDHEETVR